jgi:hypothetical protein
MHAPLFEADILGSILDKIRTTEGRSEMMFKVRYSAYIVNKYIQIFYFNTKNTIN